MKGLKLLSDVIVLYFTFGYDIFSTVTVLLTTKYRNNYCVKEYISYLSYLHYM